MCDHLEYQRSIGRLRSQNSFDCGNAEVLEDCSQWLSSEEFSGVHIKLIRRERDL